MHDKCDTRPKKYTYLMKHNRIKEKNKKYDTLTAHSYTSDRYSFLVLNMIQFRKKHCEMKQSFKHV